MLGTLTEDQKSNWKDHVNFLVWAYNSTRHESTGYSPYYLMFGRHPQLPIDTMLGLNLNDEHQSLKKYTSNLKEKLNQAFKTANDVREKMLLKNQLYYNQKARGATLQVGDIVLVRNVGLKGRQKLADRYLDVPYKIMSQPDPNIPVYKLKEVDGSRSRILHRNLLLPVASSISLS